MKIYIYGIKGGMGRRYRAICESLGHEVGGEDIYCLIGHSRAATDAIIVATPTPTHAEILYMLRDCGRPILCEKPLATNPVVVETLLEQLKRAGTRIAMVNQYAELDDPRSEGETTYNCFRHGADGLYWDCISLIRLARGAVILREDSPTWECRLNGKDLRLGDVDKAYVTMIEGWLMDPTKTDYDELLRAHQKVARLEALSCRVS